MTTHRRQYLTAAKLAFATALIFLLVIPAGGLILLIESGLTLSLALTLAGLFLFLSRDEAAP